MQSHYVPRDWTAGQGNIIALKHYSNASEGWSEATTIIVKHMPIP
jgi:hypothetical protein